MNSMGGIQLRAQKERIVCNNTLDERLELCYQEALPEIRSILFPKKTN
jgi:vacuolar-type H+-ATPase subunit E/Vma4